ncbi:MAG: hypothetical protein CM1200mP34_5500 [Verrucomicrobiales bacterium]|nr:MAG: hypothetical protein CM1200mP34_5500 [Verrucomicrobiales bacterium]
MQVEAGGDRIPPKQPCLRLCPCTRRAAGVDRLVKTPGPRARRWPMPCAGPDWRFGLGGLDALPGSLAGLQAFDSVFLCNVTPATLAGTRCCGSRARCGTSAWGWSASAAIRRSRGAATAIRRSSGAAGQHGVEQQKSAATRRTGACYARYGIQQRQPGRPPMRRRRARRKGAERRTRRGAVGRAGSLAVPADEGQRQAGPRTATDGHEPGRPAIVPERDDDGFPGAEGIDCQPKAHDPVQRRRPRRAQRRVDGQYARRENHGEYRSDPRDTPGRTR